ncbi:hypothetical protein CGH99_07070 [Vibrio parahaemolyticus]|uniref:DUF2726 domain-containing protein n=1 Tax=Vibrio parahaemolyticus TaxID=670 RepID=UPI001123809C|nr:DUF2726 domain-containing protein [Vibrio parahaemolyticus]EJG0729932.1 DUF2726 domain-containing protein [Vibrio parahaemolyticus]EJG0791512.1 DUF2726 domain-containing protein [Vibrio parahaemolyticus]EJG0963331.1 DUF2726 domain-containing protein [Vibrio parahaemolyticus]EJG1034028.1 DUF2726 domain-containing protein [Vibrio parahaemolyticus]TOL41495.1 hypothetical protein CGH99_07070 [Vibrio parahaemolyticus]
MSGLIILLSVGCIVYLFSKKSEDPSSQKRVEPGFWQSKNNSNSAAKIPPSPKDIKIPKDLIFETPIPDVKPQAKKIQSVPHKKSDYLGTKTERNFYRTLQKVLPEDYVIHCQVSLMALVQPVNFRDNSRTWAKRMDYVITDRDTRVLAVIELDDSSHRLKKRQERDLYVNDALEGRHKLLRFEAKSNYDPVHIAKIIERNTDIQCNTTKPVTQYS